MCVTVGAEVWEDRCAWRVWGEQCVRTVAEGASVVTGSLVLLSLGLDPLAWTPRFQGNQKLAGTGKKLIPPFIYFLFLA